MTKHKGSLTVEAALVLPIVFLTVLIIIYLMIIFYEKAKMQAVANEVAREISMNYKNQASSHRDLYWRIYDTKKISKINDIKDTIREKLRDDNATVTVDIKNKIVTRELYIDIKKDYYLGNTLLIATHGYSKATIEDTTEMIRVIDMADDLAGYIPGYVEAKGKYNETINRFLTTIERSFR